jgi:hypothetical protein
MTRDVFISHAGDDASVAVEVCALLEKRGLKCWMAPREAAPFTVTTIHRSSSGLDTPFYQ